jgi:hypothetical protein
MAVTALGALLSPIGLVVLAVAAVIAIVALMAAAWHNDWGGIKTRTQEVMGEIGSRVSEGMEKVKGFINSGLELIRGWWDEHGESVRTIVNVFWGAIKGKIDGYINDIKAIIDTVIHRPIWHPESREAKMAFAKEYLKVYATLAAIYSMAALFLKDDEKEINWAHPTASGWGAIPLANGQQMNILAPIAAVLRQIARLAMGRKWTPKGEVNLRSSWLPFASEEQRQKEVPYKEGQEEDFWRFVRQKLHPGFNAAWGQIKGEDFYGRRANRLKLLLQGFTPIGPWQTYETAKISGIPTAAAATALEFFGISARPDYESPEYKAYDAEQKAAIKQLAPSAAPSSTSRYLTRSTGIDQ